MWIGLAGVGTAPNAMAGIVRAFATPGNPAEESIKDYLFKMRNFDERHADDLYIEPNRYPLLVSSLKRLRRMERTVGYGNFHLLDFDDALRIAAIYSIVGRFTRKEIDFLESIFYENANRYGFYGRKPVKDLTARIERNGIVKVRHTGHYLYSGRALQTYRQIRRAIGNRVVLTSGVRSIMKQFVLFLDKACRSGGNLSLASRSLAPPGYSYHCVGDFDVGQVGLGALNFTARFATTEVFRQLQDLGYVRLRYGRDNRLGVRYEPWHVKVVTES
jgi:zinc D-Ala-D-Ala carboxypeptidase